MGHPVFIQLIKGRSDIDDKHFIELQEISTFRLGKCLLVKSNLQMGINPTWLIKIMITTPQQTDKPTDIGKSMYYKPFQLYKTFAFSFSVVLS